MQVVFCIVQKLCDNLIALSLCLFCTLLPQELLVCLKVIGLQGQKRDLQQGRSSEGTSLQEHRLWASQMAHPHHDTCSSLSIEIHSS